MPSSLPRGAPADQRVDPAAILSFLDAVEARPDVEMHSLMVVRHGRVVAEGWWAPYSAERPQLLYSLSKSFTATAAAFAQDEGLLDLDDTVISHFAEFAADITDPRSRRLARLELPTCPGAPAPADWGPWASGPFTITASTAGTQVQPFLTSIEVVPRAGGWQISLIEPANALTFPVGAGAWTVSDHADRDGETIPVAASGGWHDGNTLRAEVIFPETPHRMDITCSLPGRTAEAVWRHPPLSPSKLQHLHCPA